MNRVSYIAHPCSPIAPSTPPRVTVIHASEVPQMAKDAAQASLWGRKEAADLWYQVATACRSLKISFQSLLALSSAHGDTLASIVFTSRDYPSCVVIFASLPNGSFIEGQLVRNSKQITYAPEGGEHAIGLRYADDGELYTGDFFRGIPHGTGVLDTYRGVIYSGEFLEGRMTGWGKLTSDFQGHRQREGIFIDGVYKGNPRIAGQQPQRGHFFSQCRKLMGINS